MGGGFLADILKFVIGLFINKAWEQAKLEDTVEDAIAVLDTIEIEVDRSVDLDDDLDSEFDAWLSNADSDALRPSEQVAA